MRVALVQVPRRDKDRFVPVGLLSLATSLKRHGHDPIIIDFNIPFQDHRLSAEFFKETASSIFQHSPDLVGFSAMYSTLPATLLVAEEYRNMAPSVPIVMGGPEVSFEEVDLLRSFGQVDMVARGEAEVTLLEVLEALEKGRPLSRVLGITYREGTNITRNPDRPVIRDLDDLPYLDYSLLPHRTRYDRARVEAGRGCPMRCKFCSTSTMWKKQFRIKSPDRIVGELRNAWTHVHKNGGAPIALVHDHLLFSPTAVQDFLSLMKNEEVPWMCYARLDALSDDMIRSLGEAGCQGVCIGVESGSPEVLKALGKNVPLRELPRVLEMLSRFEIIATLSFMIGLPNETTSQIDDTLLLALRSKLVNYPGQVQIFTFTVLKGSTLYDAQRSQFVHGRFGPLNDAITMLHEAEVDLVRRYPHVFPSYYQPIDAIIDPRLLQRISILYNFLADFFPLSTLLLVEERGGSPLEVGSDIISFFDEEDVEWVRFAPGEYYLRHYLNPLERFIRCCGNDVVRNVFLHEKYLNECCSDVASEPSAGKEMPMEHCPKMVLGMKVKTFGYDVGAAYDVLREGDSKDIEERECYVAYVPGRVGRAISLSVLSYHLLSYCNGERSMRGIVDLCTEEEERRGSTGDIIRQRLEFMCEQGIIR